MELYSDEYFMNKALDEAKQAFEEEEIPIGAVVVFNNKIIGRGYNQSEKLTDVTAHAEMIAITAASAALSSKYLEECTMFVTVEPCTMCAGAIRWSRLSRIVFGAKEPKFGYSKVSDQLMNPQIVVTGGVLEEDCARLMKGFFELRRKIN